MEVLWIFVVAVQMTGMILLLVQEKLLVIFLTKQIFIYKIETTKEKGHYAFKNDWARNKKTGVM